MASLKLCTNVSITFKHFPHESLLWKADVQPVNHHSFSRPTLQVGELLPQTGGHHQQEIGIPVVSKRSVSILPCMTNCALHGILLLRQLIYKVLCFVITDKARAWN